MDEDQDIFDLGDLWVWRGSKFGPYYIGLDDSLNAEVSVSGWVFEDGAKRKPGTIGAPLFSLGAEVVNQVIPEIPGYQWWVRLLVTVSGTEGFDTGDYHWDLVPVHPTEGRLKPIAKARVFVRDPSARDVPA